MAKVSNSFPKDSCPISESRRNLVLEYLNAKRELEVKELWAEAFEKVADKTFQIPYWRSFIQASLPSSDAKEVNEAIGVFYWNTDIPGFGTKLSYGFKFSVSNPFIIPQLSRSSALMIMAKGQLDALFADPRADEKSSFFYNFIKDVYTSSDTYLPWHNSDEIAQIGIKMKEALAQFEEQYHNAVKTPTALVFPFRDCGLFIIDDEEFNQEMTRISDYLAESQMRYQEFAITTRTLPLYGALWKKPRGAEWKKLLYTTHGMMKMVGQSKSGAKAIVKSGLFSEKQLERALAFLKDQYNPNWQAVLASPHDGLCESSVPTFWKRTKLFAEYLTWTDLLWDRLINGQAYKNRVQLTENFPNMSQFSYCLFMSNANASSYYSASGMSCKIPYKFPQPILMTSYSERRSYNLLSAPNSNSYISENIYRFPIGTVSWGPEDEIIAGSFETFNDSLISSILKNCEKMESKYKQAILTVCQAYKTVCNTEQNEIKEHILNALSDFELMETSLYNNDFKSLY